MCEGRPAEGPASVTWRRATNRPEAHSGLLFLMILWVDWRVCLVWFGVTHAATFSWRLGWAVGQGALVLFHEFPTWG